MENVSYDPEILSKLKQTELEIAKIIDAFCRENDVEYTLAGGTLIGAVRHKGFIPWDDDLDLMMTREMYDKFIEKWTANPVEGYFLQTDENDPLYPNNFLKIRKENTTFIQEYDGESWYPRCGIFVDIFPIDRVAPKGIRRKYQYAICAVNMLMTRNHMSEAPGVIERLLFKLPKGFKKSLKRFTYNQKTKWNQKNRKDLLYFWNGTIYGAQRYYAADTFDGYIDIDFEDSKFMSVKNYHGYLSSFFGNYMELPPVEQRVNHRPKIIDFEHSYNDLPK